MFLGQLRDSFERHRTRPAIEFAQRGYRYDQLHAAAECGAALLQDRGIQPGDRVILCLEHKEPFLLGYLGCLWCGAVPLPLNPGFKPPELEYFTADSAANAVMHDDEQTGALNQLAPRCPSVRHWIPARELMNAHPAAPYRHFEPQPADPALILYSSGTTGQPKGVVHSQANLAAAVESLAATWRFQPDDVLANVLPLFHIHGLSFATHVSLIAGSRMLVADAFHPVDTLALIDRATVFMGVPTFYYAMLKRREFRERARTWRHLRLTTCGSAPIRSDVLPELESILERPIINRYGMTECHVLTSLPIDGPWPHGSVGRSLPGIEVAIRNEQGDAAATGEPGRVFARGPNLFREYWRRPDATAQSRDGDGWFDTGDVGQFDSNGFLTLVGRSSDLIICGGFNVYPAVVERVLDSCPGVRESAVAGLPDATRGERVAAFLVASDPSLDAARIRAFCRERLVDYQCPTVIEFVPELPRNALGKVLKRALVEPVQTRFETK